MTDCTLGDPVGWPELRKLVDRLAKALAGDESWHTFSFHIQASADGQTAWIDDVSLLPMEVGPITDHTEVGEPEFIPDLYGGVAADD